ncbi:hypothetical protein KVR01_002739 [Diaporthe batatas]|uniref:uncharacterized protein n=1 Tax=Diaporthe batatas TaxID=748121 RepID=UPI001D04FD65|nr:uncharacterized protein KVR01_002739 [Diaporthe batatas]KAG8167050.1 hypothetical protein KVR01_002739 [Diaporthe batatas]
MHLYTALMVLATLSAPSVSAPVQPRANFGAPPGGDVSILNYALTLEYLERKFYQQGLANYTEKDFHKAGFSHDFYKNLKEIYFDEQTHVSFLAGALGNASIKEPTFAFPSTDAKSFVQLASVLEGVGVSAYLGAAAAIADKAYLTAAGSILTVESRHSSYVRNALGQAPFPKSFDTPLDFNAVYSLAAGFITAFAPGTPALPFKAFPPLTVQPSKKAYVAGKSPVTFTNAYANAMQAGLAQEKTPVYAVFYSGLDTYYVPVAVDSGGKDVIKAADENTISGVGVLEIGSK